jgi:hypothetical protein
MPDLSTKVIHLLAPADLAPWARAKAEDRSWKLLVFEPGQSARTSILSAGADDDASAQLEANELLGYEAQWQPAPKGYRAVSA